MQRRVPQLLFDEVKGCYKKSLDILTVEVYLCFHLQNVHSLFLRTVPPYSQQAEVWVSMLKHFDFHQVIFIHSSDQEGRAMLGQFQSKAETEDIEVDTCFNFRQPNKMTYSLQSDSPLRGILVYLWYTEAALSRQI